MPRKKDVQSAPIAPEPDTLTQSLQPEMRASHPESIGYLVREAHRALTRVLAECLSNHDVSSAQWSALRALWREDGYSQVELARRMRVEKASLTFVLDALERRGLVQRVRNVEDRRKFDVHLTPAGRHLEAALLPYAGEVNYRATVGIDPDELETFQRVIKRIITNLQ